MNLFKKSTVAPKVETVETITADIQNAIERLENLASEKYNDLIKIDDKISELTVQRGDIIDEYERAYRVADRLRELTK